MVNFQPIGIIKSCFKEKFGIPRQPGLIPEAEAILELLQPFARDEAVRELVEFSHLWVIFLFHAQIPGNWRPTVRPPRLGGNKRVGVFASRSPFRPNPIGISAVRLLKIVRTNETTSRLQLHLGGVDFLDGTPVLDIKPYIPYADSIPYAQVGYPDIPRKSQPREIKYARVAADFFNTLTPAEAKRLKTLITGVLIQDPRPAYLDKLSEEKSKYFGMKLLDYEIHWIDTQDEIIVVDVAKN